MHTECGKPEKSWHPQWDQHTGCTPFQHHPPRQVAAQHSQRGCVTWRGISSWYVIRATFGSFGCFLGLALTSLPSKPGCGQNLILGADGAHLVTLWAQSLRNQQISPPRCSLLCAQDEPWAPLFHRSHLASPSTGWCCAMPDVGPDTGRNLTAPG